MTQSECCAPGSCVYAQTVEATNPEGQPVTFSQTQTYTQGERTDIINQFGVSNTPSADGFVTTIAGVNTSAVTRDMIDRNIEACQNPGINGIGEGTVYQLNWANSGINNLDIICIF